MIHIVTSENRHLYEDAIIQQHVLRHEVYIKERKWVGLQVRDDMEFDQFDDEDTIYILAIEKDKVVGGSRLYPTTKNSILHDVCPELASIRGIPSASDIYEWTRIYAAKEKRASGRFATPIVGEIMCAGLEYAFEEGVREISFQFEAWWFPRLHQQGWPLRPLGLPTLINGEWWIAATFPVTRDVIRSTAAFYQIDAQRLVRNGLRRPLINRAA